MTWSERACEGFALAATVARDRGALLAEAGLADAARAELSSLPRELAALTRAERRARIRRMTEAPQQTLPAQGARPVRALALLAQTLPREPARAWLAAAPLPRPGFPPQRELVLLLGRIAACEPR